MRLDRSIFETEALRLMKAFKNPKKKKKKSGGQEHNILIVITASPIHYIPPEY